MTDLEKLKLARIREWLEDVLFDLMGEITTEKELKDIGSKLGRSSLLSNLESAYKITEKAIDGIDDLG